MAEVAHLPAQAYVYVIGASDGPQKIGVAREPKRRLAMLQSGNPADLIVSETIAMTRTEAFAVERQAHWLLRDDRLRGEWFDVSLGEALAALRQAHEDVQAGRDQNAEARGPKPAVQLRANATWRARLDALGFNQKRFARFIGKTENTVSRQLGGDWELPTYIKSTIRLMELLTPEQILAVEAETLAEIEIERERPKPPQP